jgi:membrane-associated phospholipid phosphatase
MRRWLCAPSLSDWILAAYFLSVIGALALAPPSDAKTRHLAVTALVLLGFLAAVVVLRARFVIPYRLLALPAMLLVYFRLREILPLVNPHDFDEALYRIDVRALGFEPTLWLERHSPPLVVEWFSFFYYSYFYFLAAWTLGVIFFDRNPLRQASFAAGFLGVLGVGHFLYMLVPGYGPIVHLAPRFAGPLHGGFFLRLVQSAVDAGGPLRDIFPSIHTAAPTLITLFAWRHYRKFAIPTTFFALNIVGATIVLRWHWAVDVAAGLLLAVAMNFAAPRLVQAYQRLRVRAGFEPDRYW